MMPGCHRAKTPRAHGAEDPLQKAVELGDRHADELARLARLSTRYRATVALGPGTGKSFGQLVHTRPFLTNIPHFAYLTSNATCSKRCSHPKHIKKRLGQHD
jgi:hypothetical protein